MTDKIYIKITGPKEGDEDSRWGRSKKMNYLIGNTYEVLGTTRNEYFWALIKDETSKNPEQRWALNNHQFIRGTFEDSLLQHNKRNRYEHKRNYKSFCG